LDLADDGWILNAGDDLGGAAEMFKDGDVDFEYASQSLRPRHSEASSPGCFSVPGTICARKRSTIQIPTWKHISAAALPKSR